jgi:cyclohexadienyl dehydratase
VTRVPPSVRLSRRSWLGGVGVAMAALAARVAHAQASVAAKERGVLRVGSSGDYAPFSSTPEDVWTGLDVDLAMRLAKDLGARIEFVPFAWKGLAGDVERRRFDVAASGITVRGDRALVGRFSRPYAITGAVALVRRGDRARLSSLAALNQSGVRLVVNRGGHLERVARRLFPAATLVPLDENVALASRVTSGAADAAVSDSAEAHAVRSAGLATVGPFTRDRKALFFPASAGALAASCDDWLRAREQDGFLPALRRRWLGPAGSGSFADDREAVLADLQTRAELMPLVAAAKRAANLPTLDAAQEARVLARVSKLGGDAGLEPGRVAALYTALMTAAKAMQVAAPLAPPTATLDELRAALGAIDEHLISGLRFARKTSAVTWRAALAQGVTADGLTPELVADIAAALGELR